ncbi:MAG: MFS transporter, partial [Gammaproteobacteria bacterium]
GFFSPAWMSPTFATVQNLVKPHMRALASAVLLFFLNLIGLGAGPQVVGILNDVLNPLLGDEAVRYSLLIVKLTSIGAAILFVLAGRHLVEDLRTTGALGEAT